MKVQEIMTMDPATCRPDTPLQECAKQMVDCDCGALPVVDAQSKPVGIVTDRDITCRVVAQGKNPLELTVQAAMTPQVVTVSPEMNAEDCSELMEEKQIRRAIVVDDAGKVVGIVAMADLVRALGERASDLVEGVSQPTQEPSAVV